MERQRIAQNGFTLVEIIIVCGAAMIVSLISISVFAFVARTSSQTTSLVQLNNFKRMITTMVANQEAWTQTLSAGSASGPSSLGKMDCLVNGTPCTVDGTVGGDPIRNQPFALYGSDGTLAYDSTHSSNGLTTRSTLCNSFSGNGSANCPLRYNLTWSAVCAAGDCVNPQVRVSGTLSYAPPPSSESKLSFNPNDYQISVYSMPPLPVGAGGSGSGSTAPQVVQHLTAVATFKAFNTYTVKMKATTPGNLLAVAVFYPPGSAHCTNTVSDNGGNAYTNIPSAYARDPGSGSIEVYYISSMASASKLTVNTLCGVTPTVFLAEVEGLAAASPVGTVATASNQPSSAIANAPVVNAAANDFVFSFVNCENFLGGITPGNRFSGMPPQFGDTSGYFIPSLSGSYGASWSQSPAGTYAGATIAFKSAH